MSTLFARDAARYALLEKGYARVYLRKGFAWFRQGRLIGHAMELNGPDNRPGDVFVCVRTGESFRVPSAMEQIYSVMGAAIAFGLELIAARRRTFRSLFFPRRRPQTHFLSHGKF